MSRHSKNNTTRQYFTYEERKKLNQGTQKIRLGTDSLLPFDSCCLCLKPCLRPVVTPYGYLYCRDCILENILAQKKEIKRLRLLYEEQEKNVKIEKVQQEEEKKKMALEKFEMTEEGVRISKKDSGSKADNDPSYWLKYTENKKSLIENPSKKKTVDPSCGKPLRVKELTDVSFTKSNESTERKDSPSSAIEHNCRFQCPACCKTFNNALKGVILRGCGHTLCVACNQKLMKKEPVCLICGEKVKNPKKDIIELQTAGMSFAGSGKDKVQTTKYTPVLGFA